MQNLAIDDLDLGEKLQHAVDSDPSQFRRYLKFKLSNHLRYFYWKSKLKHLGSRVYIDRNVEFHRFPENISVGDQVAIKEGAKLAACLPEASISIGHNTTIGYNTFLFASREIRVGNNCLIAPFVYIVDSDHSIDRNKLINQQKNQSSSIFIGDDVWIGTGARILKGVTIGTGAVIAAGAVVRDNVPEYHIYGGIPAVKIGERK